MTLITGTFKDSGGVALASGILRVQLNAPLTDADATPDAIHLGVPHDFTITNGVLETCNLEESQSAQVSYVFSLFQSFTDYDYFYAGTGEFYASNDDRPSHLHTDSKYYTGVTQSAESLPLERVARPRLEAIGQALTAIVPNINSVDFSQLVPTGVTSDRLPSGARQIATLIASDPDYQTVLGEAILNHKGDYNAATFYRTRQWVSYDGGSWYSKYPLPHQGNTPYYDPDNPSIYWAPLALRGVSGVGTSGNDTAYDATGWNGQTDAPSRNAVRDIVEQLLRANNAALTGIPTAPTAAVGTNTTQIATTAFAIAEILARLNNAALTGNPTAPNQDPNVAVATNGSRIANMNAVKGSIHRYSRIIDSKATGTSGGNSVAAGIVTRDLNTISVNAGDVVTLSANTFTLRPGTYRIFASIPSHQAGVNRAFLWSVTGSLRILVGQNAQTPNGTQGMGFSVINGQFAIASNTDFQIRHFTNAAATGGLGLAVGEAGVSEIYTTVEIWRVD